MNIPQFTAQVSLYRTSNRYRSAGSELSGLSSTQSVVAAYIPGASTQSRCNLCLKDCDNKLSNCLDFAAVGSIFFPLGVLQALCYSDASDCRDQCATPGIFGSCCPKVCGPRNSS